MTATTLHKAHNHSYIRGELTVHYTRNTPGTAYPRVRTICGQSSRRTYFGVIATARAGEYEVNCEKCLASAAKIQQS